MPSPLLHKSFVFVLAAAILCVASVPIHAAPACDCSHLDALKIELKNARTLQTRFQQEAQELKKLGPDSSTSALKQFAETKANQGIQAPPGYQGPSSVEYVPAGDNVSVDAIGSRANKDLCAFSKNTDAELAQVDAAATCKDIADAVRVHENYHQSQCLASGYRAYRSMHGADRAMEEANAYNAQALKLREAIRHVLENSKVEVWIDTKVHTDGPPNPIYTGIETETNGRIKTTNATSSPTELRFEGQGTYRFNFTPLGGNCQANGVPISIQARAIVITDGETAKVSWQPTGTTPSFGMQCRVPGGGKGYGMSIPVPIDPRASAQNDLPLPFEDGAKLRTDMARSQAAQIMSGAGVTMSGYAEIGINLVCSPPQ